VRVLVVGGTRFMGYHLAWRLLAGGHQVTLLNRGNHPDPFGDRVERLRADRTTPELGRVLSGRSFDAAVDFTAFRRADAEGALAALDGRLGHYVMISTGQVYLVKRGVIGDAGPEAPARAFREEDYDGPLMAEPPAGDRDRGDWDYGVGKRGAEDALAEAWERRRFPCTRIRIPIVNGERDHTRRLEGYVRRVLDGGPVLLPDGGESRVRQVYAGAVVSTIAALLGREVTFGRAYNLCQEETPTLAELVALIAEIVGAEPRVVDAPVAEMARAGLDPVAASPFSTRWKSFLDPSRAGAELGFRHPPLRDCLERTLGWMLAEWRDDPPAGYAQRARERAFAGERDRR
jgi:nucleoside-diphosphate-sugar epimerase